MDDVNQRISDFNLIAPTLSRQLFPLSVDGEVERAKGDVVEGGENSKWMKHAEEKLKRQQDWEDRNRVPDGIFGLLRSSFGFR